MRGHEQIIRMRVAGQKPAIVFMCDFLTPKSLDWHNPGEKYGEKWLPDHATVEFEPTERIERLDLRFLNGLRVSLSCSTENRAKALSDACKRHGATMVAATHAIEVNPHRFESGWTEIWHKEQSNG